MISTSNATTTDMAGHLIIANGVICGDYSLQLTHLEEAKPNLMAGGNCRNSAPGILRCKHLFADAFKAHVATTKLDVARRTRKAVGGFHALRAGPLAVDPRERHRLPDAGTGRIRPAYKHLFADAFKAHVATTCWTWPPNTRKGSGGFHALRAGPLAVDPSRTPPPS